MNITRQILDAFIDDHLNEQETIKVEKALRESPELQAQLTDIIKSRDMGDHSIGAIWRREHLSCPSREELLSYQDEALDLDRLDYIKFHLETVGCRACKANLSDLKNANPLPEDPALRKKHQQFLENSKILLPKKTDSISVDHPATKPGALIFHFKTPGFVVDSLLYKRVLP